jgi:hypothetical protein
MYQNTNFYTLMGLPGSDSKSNLVNAALQQYHLLHWGACLKRIAARLVGRSTELDSLSEIEAGSQVRSRRSAGVRSVAISQIVGSADRAQDFDREFAPLQTHTRSRWLSVALALAKDIPLPAVTLVQVGTRYYVVDGHHRISVARAMEMSEIEADVTVWELAPAPAAKVSELKLKAA